MTCQIAFNPRAHVGRDRRLTTASPFVSSFNPRAHVGRDLHALEDRQVQRVSIHAPTWGATLLPSEEVDALKVSIHAPTWGATLHIIVSVHG